MPSQVVCCCGISLHSLQSYYIELFGLAINSCFVAFVMLPGGQILTNYYTLYGLCKVKTLDCGTYATKNQFDSRNLQFSLFIYFSLCLQLKWCCMLPHPVYALVFHIGWQFVSTYFSSCKLIETNVANSKLTFPQTYITKKLLIN